MSKVKQIKTMRFLLHRNQLRMKTQLLLVLIAILRLQEVLKEKEVSLNLRTEGSQNPKNRNLHNNLQNLVNAYFIKAQDWKHLSNIITNMLSKTLIKRQYYLHNKELYISPFKLRIKVNSYQHN